MIEARPAGRAAGRLRREHAERARPCVVRDDELGAVHREAHVIGAARWCGQRDRRERGPARVEAIDVHRVPGDPADGGMARGADRERRLADERAHRERAADRLPRIIVEREHRGRGDHRDHRIPAGDVPRARPPSRRPATEARSTLPLQRATCAAPPAIHPTTGAGSSAIAGDRHRRAERGAERRPRAATRLRSRRAERRARRQSRRRRRRRPHRRPGPRSAGQRRGERRAAPRGEPVGEVARMVACCPWSPYHAGDVDVEPAEPRAAGRSQSRPPRVLETKQPQSVHPRASRSSCVDGERLVEHQAHPLVEPRRGPSLGVVAASWGGVVPHPRRAGDRPSRRRGTSTPPSSPPSPASRSFRPLIPREATRSADAAKRNARRRSSQATCRGNPTRRHSLTRNQRDTAARRAAWHIRLNHIAPCAHPETAVARPRCGSMSKVGRFERRAGGGDRRLRHRRGHRRAHVALVARPRGPRLVLDHGPIGGGQTARTSAHLSSALDDLFYLLSQLRRGGARLAGREPRRGDRRDRATSATGIECDFRASTAICWRRQGARDASCQGARRRTARRSARRRVRSRAAAVRHRAACCASRAGRVSSARVPARYRRGDRRGRRHDRHRHACRDGRGGRARPRSSSRTGASSAAGRSSTRRTVDHESLRYPDCARPRIARTAWRSTLPPGTCRTASTGTPRIRITTFASRRAMSARS